MDDTENYKHSGFKDVQAYSKEKDAIF